MDLRQRLLLVSGQEVLSSDSVGLKVSVAATFEVADPEKVGVPPGVVPLGRKPANGKAEPKE